MNIDTEIREIIETDYRNNHNNRPYNLNDVFNAYQRKTTHKEFKIGPVIVIYKNIGNSTVNFHCINGGNGKDLTKAVNAFLLHVQPDYDYAVVYYDNPKIEKLFDYIVFDNQTEKINQGLDRTYLTRIMLRS